MQRNKPLRPPKPRLQRLRRRVECQLAAEVGEFTNALARVERHLIRAIEHRENRRTHEAIAELAAAYDLEFEALGDCTHSMMLADGLGLSTAVDDFTEARNVCCTRTVPRETP